MWTLALAYAVHLLSTVMWLGVVLSMFDLERVLFVPGDAADVWLRKLRFYLRLAWMAVALLWASGMFQMSHHPLYAGFLQFTNAWARALLVKHLLVFVWMVVLAYLQWVRLPTWERQVLRAQAKTSEPDEALLRTLRREIMRPFRLQQGLALVILAVTAWLRAQT